MKEVFRTQNPAELALVKSLLQVADIAFFALDEHTNAIYGGAMAFTACRIMVLTEEYADAAALLAEAGLEIYDRDT